MPHYFSRLVATRRLDLELQLTRETPQAWLLGESEHGEALLHIEGHEPLTAFIVAQPRLWNREAVLGGTALLVDADDDEGPEVVAAVDAVVRRLLGPVAVSAPALIGLRELVATIGVMLALR